jgi:hypothetical protein
VISDQLILTIVEWKIIDKVAFITVDNASSIDVSRKNEVALLIDGDG